ncbi:MAG TPA: hypothetical protein VMV46_03945 [Thermoanaerobaculia bacterium]|nr:hypothetical protein [Thermoanaerobaculia bacterium]
MALGTLLAALLLGALGFDPGRWPSVVGDEATYLMAAQSLAWDGDLRYTLEDLERFRRLQGREPDGLILQHDEDGVTLRYAKPAFYPLALAPFVRLLPRQGAAVANVLALALAAWCTALALERTVGAAAPLWVASFVGASVIVAHVFWAHADLLLTALVALALSGVTLVREGADREARERSRSASISRREDLVLVLAGAAAGVVAICRPLYLVVALPLLVAAGSRRRRLPVAAGLALAVALSLAGNQMVRGTWSSYAGERHGYYAYTGFPLEGEGRDAAALAAESRPSASWTERLVPFGFDLRVSAWNLVYLAVGRHVGLLPYFLPLVLGFVAWRNGPRGWALLAAVAAVAAAFLVLRPFNFWGGGGALANRYLLPVVPCLWFLAERRRGAWPAIVVALAAAPFLWPTWTAPRGFLRDQDGGYRHVSAVAQRVLPYETTQNQLKPAGSEDFVHHALGGSLWVKPLSPGVRSAGDARIEARVGHGSLGLLVGSPRPIDGMSLVVDPGVEVAARLGLRRVHRMWWTPEPYFLYPVDVEASLRALPITLAPGQWVGFRLAFAGSERGGPSAGPDG